MGAISYNPEKMLNNRITLHFFILCYSFTIFLTLYFDRITLGGPLAEMERCSRPFEPDLDDTSGGKWSEPLCQPHLL